MGATERVKQYLSYKGVSKYKFYQKTGFSNKFLDNSSNMGTNKAEIIIRYYPDLNLEWLITGEGQMLVSGDVQEYPDGHSLENQIVESPKEPYNCTNCDEKGRMIEALLSANEALRIEIEKIKKEKNK